MNSSPGKQEKFTKQKFLEFLKHGTTYRPFERNITQFQTDFSNQSNQGFNSDRKVEQNRSSSYKSQIFQPYQQERNGLGKIIVQKQHLKNDLEMDFEKKLSQYELYKKKILNRKLIDSLERVKNFKIDTATQVTPRNQPIQKNGKLLFDKGLKVKQQLFIQNKKNTILASISQFSNQQSTQNLSKIHLNHSQSNQRISNETKHTDLQQQQDQQKYPEVQDHGSDKSNKNKMLNLQNKYHVLNYLKNRPENQGIIQLLMTDSKLSKTQDHSIEENMNSNTSNKNQRIPTINYYLSKPNKNGNKGEQTANTSNRSFLTSVRQDDSKTTLNQSKLTNSEYITNKNSNKPTLNQIQATQEQLIEENINSDDIQFQCNQQIKRPYLPQLTASTESYENLQKEDFTKSKQSGMQESAAELKTSENIKDNRTLYQTNLPLINQSSYFDYPEILFYSHDLDEMVPFESFKKYKFNHPKNGIQTYQSDTGKLKMFNQKKNQSTKISNNSSNIERCFSDRFRPEQIVPPVGTYEKNYSLIEKKIPTFTIKQEHIKQLESSLKSQNQENKIKTQAPSSFKKINKTEVDDESFEKMYFDLIKSIQNEVQEQIQKCGDKYLHPDGDLQLQRHLSIEDIQMVDQRFKVQAKHLKDKLNKMKAYLTFYQYQV
ncbi:hypothetical protein TTHERM_00069220 (macronuclear) [Tetrahymena thermophila SB210]|uniref:Uncharacterized protein n=1 Tax=Tetrahymena thermophila (strain SB210) TaxID=312017 RepID=I7M0G2_TETTS|nr:hypothetical protein TTHERM_00069220 [Tetrahymena thermophila SB210]EAR87515.2 hypothetical protein TTHERM_00069220 [Tetrahymena thermophila SB210]|eukprot:XP_001007760.2 hypothetical protein TTHERM_00069220 [Tetrahymena thermophila SB210]